MGKNLLFTTSENRPSLSTFLSITAVLPYDISPSVYVLYFALLNLIPSYLDNWWVWRVSYESCNSTGVKIKFWVPKIGSANCLFLEIKLWDTLFNITL